ncbi:cupin domain-containing protein [Roseicella frigidaeris]|uniref:Cupin domain-containing protein n=1 Tax=Roseicella frigidaeris TaxID=2230885 RepID=A0A327M3P9_9PROT|nr:cupin domain-containing protein [Roseicella frigidaeris]RAI56954.1 cupin domain-containing protein [Roseicella frigidaeris]
MPKALLLAAALLLAPIAARAEDPGRGQSRVTVVFDHALPNIPGKSLKGVLVEYGPGAATPAHRHAASAFITATVLDGAIRSAVNRAPARVYRKGESFTEAPGDHHAVSANASDSAPATLLAIFVVDTAETALTILDPG